MDGLEGIEKRLLTVEQAVMELAIMSKYLRYMVFLIGAGVGIDVGGLV